MARYAFGHPAHANGNEIQLYQMLTSDTQVTTAMKKAVTAMQSESGSQDKQETLPLG